MPRVVVLVLALAAVAACFKPVVIMHGILDSGEAMQPLVDMITKAHPGTEVTALEIFDGLDSTRPMWYQVDKISQLIDNVTNDYSDGFHIISYSQGGLSIRAYLEETTHNVDTWVALSSPHMGQFGTTDYLKFLFPNYTTDELYKLLYTKDFQGELSVANYWVDPFELPLYLSVCDFLPVLNNETNNPLSEIYRTNFLRLSNLILIGGPDDGVITPWQSAFFSPYHANSTTHVVPMNETDVYLLDSFGLQTLDLRGGITSHVVPGVPHKDWYQDQTVFDNYIEPVLT